MASRESKASAAPSGGKKRCFEGESGCGVKWNKNQEGTGTNPGPDCTQTPGSTETTAPDTTTKPSGTTGIWYPSAGTNPAQTTEPTIVPAQTTEPTVVPVQTAIPTVVPVQTAEPSSVPTQAPENEKTEEPLDVDKTINKVTKKVCQ